MRRALQLTPAQQQLADAERAAKDLAPLFADAWRKVVDRWPEESGWRKEFVFNESRGWRADFAHVGTRVLVEVDGGQRLAAINKRTGKPFAIGRHALDEDHWKITTAVSLGWKVFQFTPTMLTRDPHRCITLVALAMGFQIKGDQK